MAQHRYELKGVTPHAPVISPEQQRNQALEAQVRPLKHNNDLLKKLPPYSQSKCKLPRNRSSKVEVGGIKNVVKLHIRGALFQSEKNR